VWNLLVSVHIFYNGEKWPFTDQYHKIICAWAYLTVQYSTVQYRRNSDHIKCVKLNVLNFSYKTSTKNVSQREIK
jgi:hypothetical protein